MANKPKTEVGNGSPTSAQVEIPGMVGQEPNPIEEAPDQGQAGTSGDGEAAVVETADQRFEKLEKSYKELHAEFTRKSQLLAEQDRMISQIRNVPSAPPPAANIPQDFDYSNPAESIRRITAQTIVQQRNFEEIRKLQSDPKANWNEMYPYIQHVVANNPWIERTENPVQTAYGEAVKLRDAHLNSLADIMAQKLNISREAAKAEIVSETESRRAVAGVGGQPSTPQPSKDKRTKEEIAIDKMSALPGNF